ncbi:MAG: amidohydrolase [Clostridiales bacterium]|nr:amidohydrolase [Clostridiales bacterium]
MIEVDGKSMKIIDAHVHIWDKYHGVRYGSIVPKSLGYGKIELNGVVEKLLPPAFVDNRASAEILLGYMGDNGIDSAVILQNPCYGDQKEYVAAAMGKWPDHFVATMGKVDPRDTKHILSEIDDLVKNYKCKGIKIEIPDVPFWIDDPEYAPMWEKVVNDDLICVLDLGFEDGIYDWNIDRLTKLLHRYPTIRMRLPHLGISRLWDKSQIKPYPELQKMLKLFTINRDNLTTDFSAMPFFDPDGDYPDYRNREILKIVYEAIGPKKMIWGTDFPTILKLRTIKQCIHFVTRHCDFLTFEDKQDIMCGNVTRELRLG